MQNSIKYIALLRGINVGGKNKVAMQRLKSLFENIGFTDVFTYINSGNIIFSSNDNLDVIPEKIEEGFKSEFGFEVPILIKSKKDIERIAKHIPNDWQNNKEQRTDVAFLFPQIDSIDIIEKLPFKKEFFKIIYAPGALIWNIEKHYLNQSQLSKLAGHKLYQQMTVRNVNTARHLANWDV